MNSVEALSRVKSSTGYLDLLNFRMPDFTRLNWVGERAEAIWAPRLASATLLLSELELAEACDVPVRWSCRTGVCHTCETTLVAGDVRYDPDPVEPPADGSALICCSQPLDEVVLDL